MKLRILLAASLVLTLTAVELRAGDLAAEIQHLGGLAPPTIDGVAGDAAWEGATAHGTSEFFNDNPPTDPGTDLSIQWKARWDESNLYVLIEATDDTVVTRVTEPDFAFNDWQDDSVEIYLDPENIDSEDYNAGGVADNAYQLTAIAGEDPVAAAVTRGLFSRDSTVNTSSFSHGTNSYAADDSATAFPQGADSSAGTFDGANKVTFEVAFPWTALGETPDDIMARGSFGFGVAYNDNDDTFGRESQYVWGAETFDMWMRSASMPDVGLLPAPPPAGGGDFDGTGMVGNGDLTLLLDGWGGAPGAGWVNDVPVSVGNDSLTILLDNWGNDYTVVLSAVGVPEPSCLAIAVLATMSSLALRRRR